MHKDVSILALGLMSGTSLDGLDMALVEFSMNSGTWSFDLKKARTARFSKEMYECLKNVYHASAFELAKLNHDYGVFCGEEVVKFLEGGKELPSLIASHGQTIFHRPDLGFTTQIGSGAAIAAISKIETISDFRSLDVALGGNGAPLVPIADHFLFQGYDACLNIGGIANVSYVNHSERYAYDICAANLVLNHLSSEIGLPYDAYGKIAATNHVNETLLKRFDSLEYYQREAPKSLGFEFVESDIFPLLNQSNLPTEELIATYTYHLANRIQTDLEKIQAKHVLVTGGGAHNAHLVSLLRSDERIIFELPSTEIIEFKEAICFAFLGVLRKLEMINTLKTVTGARFDSIGGSIYLAS